MKMTTLTFTFHANQMQGKLYPWFHSCEWIHRCCYIYYLSNKNTLSCTLGNKFWAGRKGSKMWLVFITCEYIIRSHGCVVSSWQWGPATSGRLSQVRHTWFSSKGRSFHDSMNLYTSKTINLRRHTMFKLPFLKGCHYLYEMISIHKTKSK
jgi:hypothetical protein